MQKVPRLGAKTYEQCVGFMRISEGENILDRTPIHPESYAVVDRLFKELQVSLDKLGSKELAELLDAQRPENLAVKLEVGVPTRAIYWTACGAGTRSAGGIAAPIFRQDVLKIEDLMPGMERRERYAMSSILAPLWISASRATDWCIFPS